MKKFLARLFGGNTSPHQSEPTTPVAGQRVDPAATDAADYLALVQVKAGTDPVPMTLGDLLECDTREKLLQRAAEKTRQAVKPAAEPRATRPRPDPADYKDRPIGDYLKALGVPEDTSRYEKEQGVTTLYYRLGRLRRPKPADPSSDG